MIDIHNHSLCKVDDGASSFEESLTLLKGAQKEGITDIILTPHFMKGGEYRYSKKSLDPYFEAFKKAAKAKGITINLHTGNEHLIHKDLDELLEKNMIYSLANSHYVLVEFPFSSYKSEYDEYLYNISAIGYKVIIAHPERYNFVIKEPSFVDRWLKEGYLLQCNQSSLFKDPLSSVCFKLIEAGKVSFIASDAHNENRPATLKKAYEFVTEKYSKDVADLLFEINPRCILEDKQTMKMPVIQKKKRGLFW